MFQIMCGLAGTLPKDKERLLQQVETSVRHLSKLKSWDVYNNTGIEKIKNKLCD